MTNLELINKLFAPVSMIDDNFDIDSGHPDFLVLKPDLTQIIKKQEKTSINSYFKNLHCSDISSTNLDDYLQLTLFEERKIQKKPKKFNSVVFDTNVNKSTDPKLTTPPVKETLPELPKVTNDKINPKSERKFRSNSEFKNALAKSYANYCNSFNKREKLSNNCEMKCSIEVNERSVEEDNIEHKDEESGPTAKIEAPSCMFVNFTQEMQKELYSKKTDLKMSARRYVVYKLSFEKPSKQSVSTQCSNSSNGSNVES